MVFRCFQGDISGRICLFDSFRVSVDGQSERRMSVETRSVGRTWKNCLLKPNLPAVSYSFRKEQCFFEV